MGALAVRQALFWQGERKKPHAERAAGLKLNDFIQPAFQPESF